MSKREAPLSLRITPEMKDRLEKAADRLRISKHALAQEALEAAVDAIEKHGFRAVVPIEFELLVTHVPVEREKAPEPSGENVALNEVSAGTVPRRKKRTAGLSREQQQ